MNGVAELRTLAAQFDDRLSDANPCRASRRIAQVQQDVCAIRRNDDRVIPTMAVENVSGAPDIALVHLRENDAAASHLSRNIQNRYFEFELTLTAFCTNS